MKLKKFGRDTHQRKALFKSLVSALIIREEIKTTEAKAKAIRRIVAKLITKAKNRSLHSRRQVMAFLQDKKAANKLVDELAPLLAKKMGGFTRWIRLGKRRGDSAMIVKMEFTEKTIKKAAKTEKAKK